MRAHRISSTLLSLAFSALLAVGCSEGVIGGDDLEGVPTAPTTGEDAGDPGMPIGSDDAGELPTKKAGPGTETPFDPKTEGSTGVKLDPSGAVVLDPTDLSGGATPVIWVANSAEGTVSKVDTRTMKELARYATCPGGGCDPSRTSVSLNGDAVIVNRGGASATKIASNPLDCTGPGTGTSTGPSDVKAWGDDKCVLWNTPFPAGSLGRAAAFDAEKGVDGSLSTSVWVGLWTLDKMVQLDSKTGKIIDEVNVGPLKPYGAAVDKDHHVWVWGGGVGFIDTKKAPKTFTTIASPPCAYGIAVDEKGRVWTSGWIGGTGCVARYTPDPGSPATGKWEHVMTTGTQGRGLGIDAKGSVWAADTNFGAFQVDQETLVLKKGIPIGPPTAVTGIAIDFDGMVWAINQGGSSAHKIDPKTYAVSSVPVGAGPYTYSDMTGFQLRHAASPSGKYRQRFPGCGDMTHWKTLSWDAKTAPMTSITVRVRTGKTLDELKAAAWTVVAKVPGDLPPVDLAAKLGDAANRAFLEAEFQLESSSTETTPILSAISVKSYCPPTTK